MVVFAVGTGTRGYIPAKSRGWGQITPAGIAGRLPESLTGRGWGKIRPVESPRITETPRVSLIETHIYKENPNDSPDHYSLFASLQPPVAHPVPNPNSLSFLSVSSTTQKATPAAGGSATRSSSRNLPASALHQLDVASPASVGQHQLFTGLLQQ
jgi:hypothetical protein